MAFLPTNILPGIDFSNDPLLQGRLFTLHGHPEVAAGYDQLPPDPDQCAALPVRQHAARRYDADADAQGPREL